MNLLNHFIHFRFAIASCSFACSATRKSRKFSSQGCAAHRQPFQTRRGYGYPLSAGNRPRPLLAPYLKEAGLSPKAENYTNW